MLRQIFIVFGLLMGFLLANIAFAADAKTAPVFKVEIYKNSKCSGKAEDTLSIDANKCSSYSYTDSKGKVTEGSQNNVRCYKDKLVFDKYPFSAKCSAKESVYNGKSVVDKDHTLTPNKCQEAPSHEGPVYEKLIDYQFPGNENCTTK